MEEKRASKHHHKSKAPSGPAQCVTMQPADQLTFRPGSSKTTAVTLSLHNPEAVQVLFKIKTTERDFYGVKPNQGIIEAGEQVYVTITATAQKKPDETKKHKFLVQTTRLPSPGNADQVQDLWTNTSKDSIMESKLKCVWLDEGEAPAAAAPVTPSKSAVTPTATASVAATPTAKQPVQEAATPAMSTPTNAPRSTPADTTAASKAAAAPAVAAVDKPATVAGATTTPAATTTATSASEGLTQRKVTSQNSASTSAVALGVHPSSKSAAAGAAGSSRVMSAQRSNSNTTTAAATPSQQQQASIVILLIIFILGVVFGKFVL